jgi:HK97 family phage major capsid protein
VLRDWREAEGDGTEGGGAEPGTLLLGTEDAERVVKGVQKIAGDYDRLSKETKKAFEDLTSVKKTCNDFERAIKALEKVQRALQLETRMAFGDPIQRIIDDEEKRDYINKAALNAIGKLPPDVMRKALGEDSSPGSTLINDQLAREIFDTLALYGKWNTLGVRPLSTKTTKFLVKTARATASFLNSEGDQIDDDTTKAGNSVNCTVKPIASLVNVSLQLIEDGEFDIAQDVLEDFMEAFNQRLDAGVFMGDGTANATYGGYTGVFNFGTAAVGADGNTAVEKLDLEDFVRCLTTVAPVVLGRKSKWWIHPQILARICTIRDGNGRPLFQTALEAPAPGAIGSILGYPVELVHACPSTNTAGSKIAAFGDPNGYVVGIRKTFMFEQSDSHKWNTLQRSFRSHGRAGGIGRRADALAILTLAAA